MMKIAVTRLILVCATVVLGTIIMFSAKKPTQAAPKTAAPGTYLSGAEHGNPGFQSIGRLSFGPDGLLLVGDPKAASVVAIDTQDRGPVEILKQRIDGVDAKVAAALGSDAASIEIVDLAVNPLSGKIYLSVHRKTDNQSAILTIDADGKIQNFDLKSVSFAKVALPGGENSKVTNITDVKFAGDRVLAAGQSNEEFASKIYSIPVPLKHGSSAGVHSAETYHVAHGRWETRAPIQSFIPHEENGKQYVVGAFACTPIAKFPLNDLDSGEKVKGTSVVELGSGNRPLDMFTYKKDGRDWLVTNTYRFHFKKSLFGPSKWWGVRVNMDYLDAQDTNEKAARRDIKTKSGPEGIEIVDALFGAVHVDKLDDAQMIVLRDSDGKLDLEVAQLP